MNPNGGVDLSNAGRVSIKEMRVIPAAGLDIIAGGLSRPQMVAHAQIVDMLTGVCWLVPLPERALHTLMNQLADVVTGAGHHDTTGG